MNLPNIKFDRSSILSIESLNPSISIVKTETYAYITLLCNQYLAVKRTADPFLISHIMKLSSDERFDTSMRVSGTRIAHKQA